MFSLFPIYVKVMSSRFSGYFLRANSNAPYLVFSTVKIKPGGIKECYKNWDKFQRGEKNIQDPNEQKATAQGLIEALPFPNRK